MMKTIIFEIPADSAVIERVNRFAASRKTSVSRLAESFFNSLVDSASANEQEFSPLVKSLSIEGVIVPTDFDYKKELAEARNEKYN